MTQSNTFSPRGSEVHFESQKGRWKLKSPRMKKFLEGEKESVLSFDGEERVGGA